MKIMFVDPVCPLPYDSGTLQNGALGGTEGTVVRVSEALAKRGHYVAVKQHCRETKSGYYLPFGENTEAPTHVVVLRAPLALLQARKQFPNAKLYLWCHDIFSGPGWDQGFKAALETRATIVVVSEWHKHQLYDCMRQVGFPGGVPARRIYNPIADDLLPNDTVRDINKMVFFSSPHKGLKETLTVFNTFQNFDELKETKLYIANPGYLEDANLEGIRNVINLGSLTHAEIIQHVRSALCVLHLNNVFPETFGLVHAEANAVGTPFLSSRIGATPELCDHPGELIDVCDTKAVVDRLIQWKRGAPKVRGNANFRMKNVIREWEELLGV